MKTPKQWIRLVAIVAVTLGTLAGSANLGAATTAQPCSTWRSYGMLTVTNDPAWASVVGHVQAIDISTGQQDYTLTISQRQADYMQEAIDGGCLMVVEFTTRSTTGSLGSGSASYTASYQLQVPGNPSYSGTDSGVHPLSSCLPHGLTCQVNTQVGTFFPTVLQAGDVITLTGTATAEAIAGGTSTFDQAHADWRIRYPVLRIPIP